MLIILVGEEGKENTSVEYIVWSVPQIQQKIPVSCSDPDFASSGCFHELSHFLNKEYSM